MTSHRKAITKEQYDEAMRNNGLISSDNAEIFDAAERYGYGVYCAGAVEIDGEYFVDYLLGDSCD